MIQKERIKELNQRPIQDGDYILYWMQSSPREHCNHALEYSIKQANRLDKPLIAYFGLTPHFPGAQERHYQFLLEGLHETRKSLEERGIQMIVKSQSPEEGMLEMAQDASLVVTDCGYLRIEQQWREKAVQRINCPLVQLETNVVVPVEAVSPKEEYSAATFRRKIEKVWDDYLIPLKNTRPLRSSLSMDFSSLDLEDLSKILKKLKIDSDVKGVDSYKGGTSNALNHLNNFIKTKLDHFHELRNDPTLNCSSNMSPYLHFGQISPLHIALKILKADSPGKNDYLEQLIVRRELAINFVHYNSNYDSIDSLPDWAKITLQEHQMDKREYIYSIEEMEMAETHDPYWNAAQNEMVYQGKMHGYMRMYWGKKILEWIENPRDAYKIALYLNDRYELDGRDPNGFAGVAWCFGKHDRAWKERKIFGKVRYMNANGLRRKFKIDRYVERMNVYKD